MKQGYSMHEMKTDINIKSFIELLPLGKHNDAGRSNYYIGSRERISSKKRTHWAINARLHAEFSRILLVLAAKKGGNIIFLGLKEPFPNLPSQISSWV